MRILSWSTYPGTRKIVIVILQVRIIIIIQKLNVGPLNLYKFEKTNYFSLISTISGNLTMIQTLIDQVREGNDTLQKGYQIIIERIEKHDNVSDFTLNATNLPWGLLDKHECEW